MFKNGINYYSLVIAGLLFVVGTYAQESPMSDYTSLPGGIIIPVSSGSDVCPSLDLNSNGIIDLPNEVSSTSVFRVIADQPEIGDPNLNTFEWVVYGGWISGYQGGSIISDYQNLRTISGNIRYSYVTITGAATIESVLQSEVTVEWDTTNFSTQPAWVAVRQRSEWNCFDGRWSVFVNNIENTAPIFDASFPPDNVRLPYQISLADYTLPLPAFSDADGCNQTPFRTFTVDRPLSGPISGNEINTNVALDIGDNLVTWTVSDGSLTTSKSYTITIEPQLQILNIAWINPLCNGQANGSLRVIKVTDYVFFNSIEFSFDGGAYSETNNIGTLGEGPHHVRARVVYNVDYDNDGDLDEIIEYSEEYTCILSDNNTPAFAELPDATIKDAGCYANEDGRISVNLNGIAEYNNSVNFNGSSYLHLNKSYSNETLSEFSIATWIKAGNSAGTLLSFNNAQYYQLSLTYSSGSATARVRFQTNTEEGSFTHSTKVNDGAWHLVVATYNNGHRTIYIDGIKEEYAAGTSTTVGSATETCYGMIGARSSTSNPGLPEPNAPFFTGQMAEMAIWEGVGSALGDNEVQAIIKQGIGALGPNDYWGLNSVPLNISPAFSHVYTDLGNRSNYANWARFNGGSLSLNNSPKHYYWTNEADEDIYPASTTIENIGIGFYTLHVTDMYRCGEVFRTYEIKNNDLAAPELYWNAALMKLSTRTVTANQSSTLNDNFAANAVDGFALSGAVTQNENEPWWQVDLGGVFAIRTVNIYPNSNFGNFWVITSLTPFDDPLSSLADDLNKPGVTSEQYIQTGGAIAPIPVRIINNNARFVRIRATGNVALQMAEVEVLTNSISVSPRTLYLTSSTSNTDCFYPITSNDLSIAPFAYDACDGIVSFVHDEVHSSNTDLVDYEMPLGNTQIRWTVTDDIPSSSFIDITYSVVDIYPPVFDPWPFATIPPLVQTISHCVAETYSLPIPNVLDNYSSNCGSGLILELYNGATKIFTFTGSETETGNLFANLQIGTTNLLEWRASDQSGNQVIAALNLYVQIEPRVLEVKTSPITCNGVNNSIVTFSRIVSEPSVDVTYVISSTWPDIDPFDEYFQVNDPAFYNIPTGTYYAYIIANNCSSERYNDLITIAEPDPIAAYPNVSPVPCSGQSTGVIELTVTGGSQTNVLHFIGGDNLGASAPNYGAINLAGEGTVEAWIYLDTLGGVAGEKNYNTNLFGSAGCYGFRIEDGELVFFAGSQELSSPAIVHRQWIHVSGTWSAQNEDIILSVNGGVVSSGSVASDFAVPTGGAVYFGSGTADAFYGFIRNARIWNAALSGAEIAANFFMVDPINTNNTLQANYPIAAGGGTNLQNRALVSGAASGTVATASYAWQRFAYYWENDEGEFFARTNNLNLVVADNYIVYIDDPMACPTYQSLAIPILISDNQSPTLTFSNNGYGGVPALSPGDAIWRFTPPSSCIYTPADQEFDPVVNDHGCPVEDVTVSFEIISGLDLGYDGLATLDGVPMTDIVRLRWTAFDQITTNAPRIMVVDYLIIDNQMPEADDFVWADPLERNTDPGVCGYTVTEADSLLGMTFTDNCETGILTNNINGTSSLEGHYFGKGTHTIRWTYADKTYPGGYYTPTPTSRTIERTLTVIDDEDPVASCIGGPITVQLTQDGEYTLNPLVLNSGSSDNCLALTYGLAIYDIVGGTYTDFSTFECQHLGSNTIYLVVTDAAGLFDRCPVEVIVEDNFAPNIVIMDPIPTLQLNGAGQITVVPDDIDGGSNDNCTEQANLIRTVSPNTFDCDNIADGVITLTFTVEDESGNSDSKDAYFILEDDIPPVANCRGTVGTPIQLTLDSRGVYAINSQIDLNNGSTDNCAIAYYEIPEAYRTLGCEHLAIDVGTQLITLSVFDVAGNESTCNAYVNVIDNLPPTIVAPGYTLTLNDATGLGTLNASDLDGGTYDNCTDNDDIVFEMSINETGPWINSENFNCGNLDQINPSRVFQRWLRARDLSGNTSAPVQVPVTVRTTLSIDAIALSTCGSCGGRPRWFANVTGGSGTYSGHQWNSNPTANLYRECTNQFFSWCALCGGNWNNYRSFRNEATPYMNHTNLPAGNYTATYRVSDGNGCVVRTNYNFDWAGVVGDISAIQYDTVCSGEESVRYIARQPNAIRIFGWTLTSQTWAWDPVVNGTVVGGGGLNDNYIDVDWNEGEATGIVYYETTFIVTIPFIGSISCTEDFTFEVNIRPPHEPQFIANYNATEVCPYSIQRYTLDDQDMTGLPPNDEWVQYDWDTDGLPADATQYDGGFMNSNWIEINWGDHGTSGDVGVWTIDNRGCMGYANTGTIEIEDVNDPVIDDCPADVSHNNYPQQCSYTFSGLELPVLPIDDVSDGCLNDQNRYLYTIAATRNDAVDYSNRQYPVGLTTVTWTVTDLGGNTNVAACEQTIAILDRQAPTFQPLDNIQLAADNNCEAIFPAATRVAQATDKCATNAPDNNNNITYKLYIDFGLSGTNVEQVGYTNDPAGITFLSGTSRVTISASDDAVQYDGSWVSSPLPNTSTTSFLVNVIDETAPTIAPLPDLSFDNDDDECSADIYASIPLPGDAELTDNCTLDGDLTITFLSRSDFQAPGAPYRVGTTEITWNVSDLTGNTSSAIQNIIINDIQAPTFDTINDNALQDASITYCDKVAYRLPTPTPYDNCTGKIVSITWTVEGPNYNDPGNPYFETGTILASEYPNFKPNGGFTEPLPELPSYPITGSDYTVTWTAIDQSSNTSIDYTYILRVEIQPYIENIAGYLSDDYITPLTCGNSNDGQIFVSPLVLRTEVGATLLYSNDNGFNYQAGNTFGNLAANNYSIIITANDCYSNTVIATIPPKADYDINLVYNANSIICWDDETASINVVMTGGEPGQILFTGSGITAFHYDELDITDQGAIEAWVYLESLSDVTLVSKGAAYSLRLYDGKFTINVNGAYLDYPALADDVNLPKVQRWYHVTGTWDAIGGNMRIFINGTEQAGGSIIGTLNSAPTNTDPVTIGSGFNGIIRDVRIWSDQNHGPVPNQSLVVANEPTLMAYWKLQDGSGGSCGNECRSRIALASDANGVSAWQTTYPQPGFYTWRHYLEPPYLVGVLFNDQTPYSNAIHLESLKRGRYVLHYVDQYDCPEPPGLIRNATFIPTDTEIPDISNIGNQTVELTDLCGDPCLFCKYVIQSTDTYLWPEITDDCYFETSWRVTPYKTNISSPYYIGNSDDDDAITDAVLELGENKIEVTATQNNGNVVADLTYFISVVDRINPDAIGLSSVSANLSNDYTPIRSGIVYYNAIGFNQGSFDNCSDINLDYEISRDNGTTWADELSFNCDFLGEEVTIAFKVRDESGNEDIVYTGSTLTIQDIYSPVFPNLEEGEYRFQSKCVTVDDDVSQTLPYTIFEAGKVLLDETEYSDNCNVVRIDYALEHETEGFYVQFELDPADWKGNDPGANGEYFYEGITYIWFRIADSSDNTVERRIYEVVVLPKPAPQSGIIEY
jgi:hypothetical protein